VSIISNDIHQKIPDVARPTLTSTNQEVLTASDNKLKILGRGNSYRFHMLAYSLNRLLLLLLSFHSEQA
jgi:hypothetical protein